MNEKKDEKWLDELIARAIDAQKARFDAEKWKEKYAEEFQVLVSENRRVTRRKTMWRLAAGITAAAASVILGLTLLSRGILSGTKPDGMDKQSRYLLREKKLTLMEMSTSACYILPVSQIDHIRETKPCDILPPLQKQP